MSSENTLAPLHIFRFQLDFREDSLTSGGGAEVPVCSGAFSECSGLEATMEPKVIKEGGRNYGAAQRAGPVSFSNVVLKRGITTTRDLWSWFELVSRGGYAYRLAAVITMLDLGGNPVLRWELEKALAVKFKAADLSAQATEVGIEELHLAHEGLTQVAL